MILFQSEIAEIKEKYKTFKFDSLNSRNPPCCPFISTAKFSSTGRHIRYYINDNIMVIWKIL